MRTFHQCRALTTKGRCKERGLMYGQLCPYHGLAQIVADRTPLGLFKPYDENIDPRKPR